MIFGIILVDLGVDLNKLPHILQIANDFAGNLDHVYQKASESLIKLK
jgi:hypothetical protein